MLGDIMLAKAQLDFELTLENVQPGVWISRTPAADEGVVLLHWIQDGAVDYHNFIPLPDDPAVEDGDTASWEQAGEFSVDAGVSCALVSDILNDGGPLVCDDYDSEVVLESFMDMLLLGEVPNDGSIAVPGGVVGTSHSSLVSNLPLNILFQLPGMTRGTLFSCVAPPMI
jgi:hypothetical protein